MPGAGRVNHRQCCGIGHGREDLLKYVQIGRKPGLIGQGSLRCNPHPFRLAALP